MFENINLKILFFLIPFFCFSQEPIKWLTSVEKKSDNSYILSTTAKIQDNWRLYSQNLEEGGALPTEFVFEDESIFDSFSIVSEPNQSLNMIQYSKWINHTSSKKLFIVKKFF